MGVAEYGVYNIVTKRRGVVGVVRVAIHVAGLGVEASNASGVRSNPDVIVRVHPNGVDLARRNTVEVAYLVLEGFELIFPRHVRVDAPAVGADPNDARVVFQEGVGDVVGEA